MVLIKIGDNKTCNQNSEQRKTRIKVQNKKYYIINKRNQVLQEKLKKVKTNTA